MSRRPVAPVPKQRSGTARTVVLVAIFAILVGVIVGRGLSNTSSGTTAGGNTGGSTGGSSVTTAKSSGSKGGTTTVATTVAPTTTTVNLRSFKGIVLNGNGIKGTAGTRSTELGAIGLTMVPAADATTNNFAASALFAVDQASVAAAQALSARTGIAYSGLYPAANPPAPVEKLGGATIVLLLGKDIANQAIADKGAAAAAPAAAATTAAAVATTTTVKK